MNQKIKELIARANCTVDGTQEIDQEDIEKLCALIIKECMTICEDVAERNDPAIACYYEIKRIFWS